MAKRRDISGKKLSIKVGQTGLGPGKTMCQEVAKSCFREDLAKRIRAERRSCPEEEGSIVILPLSR